MRGYSEEMKTLRILIVDDNHDLTGYLVELLECANSEITVDVAHNGFEAGEKMHIFKPDIVLLDLMMPGLDGLATCWRIKQSEITHQVRVIAMTGFPDDENVQKIMALGAEQCLAKPFKAQVLLQALGIDSD